MSPRSLLLFFGLALTAVAGRAIADEPEAPAPFARLRDGFFLQSAQLKSPLTLADGSKTFQIELHPAGKDVVEKAVRIAEGLPPLAECADVEALTRPLRARSPPETRER